MVCSVKEFSDQARTGNVTVVNIKRFAIKALSVINVVLKLQRKQSIILFPVLLETYQGLIPYG